MSNLVERLAQQIAQDNAILFVGAELRRGEGQASAVQQIAETLAQRIDYDELDRSLPAVAQSFEVSRGRNELILALREELERLDDQPDPAHQLIADAVLPYTKVITTRFDQVLEQALRQFDKNFVLIVRDADVPGFDETQVTLIKIHGDITQTDSLVVTEDDIDDFIDNLPTVSDVIRAFFATKTLIFLGYDLNSDLFKRFFRQVGRNLSAFQRPAFAIVPQLLKETKTRYWQQQNVEVVIREPLGFLEELAAEIKEVAQKSEPAIPNPLDELAHPPLPPRPYKALDSFSGDDVPIFSGRGQEAQRLANRVLAHRLTVLYGESGSGKTSLLQAGAAPRLAERRALLALCAPAPGQPLADLLRAALTAAADRAGLEAPSAGDLASAIRAVQRRLDGPVVLAVDQFEQFFLAYESAEREQAADMLQELLSDRSLDLRLVLVLREDFLGRLQALEGQVPGLLDVRFRLERLGREAARAAIEEPAALFGLRWEPALVQTLLDDLYERGGVAPPQLQIVCDRLYGQTVESGDEVITLAGFRELGGTPAILGDYLDGAVSSFAPERQPAVRTLLGALVSSSGVKQRLDLETLARAAEVEPGAAAGMLDELTRQRIVTRYEVVGGEGPARLEYELTHDYLAARIARWLGDEFWAAQKAREIVRQALPDWQNRDHLLSPDDLRLVEVQQGRVRFAVEEKALIFASSVAYQDCPVAGDEALGEVTCRGILLRLLEHPEAFVREHAACALPAFPGEGVGAALARAAVGDGARSVREAAAQAIARPTAGDEVLDRAAVALLVQAGDDPATSAAAHEALAVIRDLEPESAELLPDKLRGPIRRRVWAARWRRNQAEVLQATLRGMQGGFVGLGLGLGLFLGLGSILAGGFAGLGLPWQTVVSAMSVGVPLAGVLGMLAAGGSGFAGAVLRSLQDREQPWRTWLLVALVSAAVLGLGFVVLAEVFVGEAQPLRALLGGALIGLALAGAAAAPLKLAAPLRLVLAVGVGVGVFLLARGLGLIFEYSLWWLLLMGGVGGAGFFWGLGPRFSGKNR